MLDELLAAIASCDRRVVLVTGAGCSKELPTNLPLGGELASDCHEQLLANGSLDGPCTDPEDLTEVAQAVYDRHRSHRRFVDCLPRDRMINAVPNEGHELAAALMAEGAIDAILTLNIDQAQLRAIQQLGPGKGIGIIRTATDARNIGGGMLVHLHGIVGISDSCEIVLRRNQLADGWKGTWRQVIAQRVMSTGHVVFVGLGDPKATVLVDNAKFIRAAFEHAEQFYMVDIAEPGANEVRSALELSEDRYEKRGWCDLMRLLGDRLATEQVRRVRAAGRAKIAAEGLEDEDLDSICEMLLSFGLVRFARLRSCWFQDGGGYRTLGEDVGRLAELLLVLAAAVRVTQTRIELRTDGIVEMFVEDNRRGRLFLASGEGERGWTAVYQRMLEDIRVLALAGAAKVIALIVSTTSTPPSGAVVDLLGPAGAEHTGLHPRLDGELVDQDVTPLLLHSEELRNDPSRLIEFVGGTGD